MSKREKLHNSFDLLEIKSVAIEIPEPVSKLKDRIERTASNTGNVILAKCSGSPLAIFIFLKIVIQKRCQDV